MAALFRTLTYIPTVMVLKRNPPHILVNLNPWFPVGTTVWDCLVFLVLIGNQRDTWRGRVEGKEFKNNAHVL